MFKSQFLVVILDHIHPISPGIVDEILFLVECFLRYLWHPSHSPIHVGPRLALQPKNKATTKVSPEGHGAVLHASVWRCSGCAVLLKNLSIYPRVN